VSQLREDVLEVAAREKDVEYRRRLIEMEVEERLTAALQKSDREQRQATVDSMTMPSAASRISTPPTIVEPDSTMPNEAVDCGTRENVHGSFGWHEMDDQMCDDARLTGGSQSVKETLYEADGGRKEIDEVDGVERIEKRKLKRHWEDDYASNVTDLNKSKCSRPVDGTETLALSQQPSTESLVSGQSDLINTSFSDSYHSLAERWRSSKKDYLDKSRLEILAEMGVSMRAAMLNNGCEEEAEKLALDSVQEGSQRSTDIRKKRRPDPLVFAAPTATISDVADNYSYCSWLRSPRVFSGASQIPYTPPPMLSPARNGSGLFWSVAPARTPAAAFRQQSAFSYTEQAVDLPPPSDIHPHINVGEQFQASLPSLSVSRAGAAKLDDHAELLWHPDVISTKFNDIEVKQFDTFGCNTTAAAAMPPPNLPKNEYALHLLNLWHGGFKNAMMGLLQTEPSRGLHTNLLQSTSLNRHNNNNGGLADWSTDEMEHFQQAVLRYGKDFSKISDEVGTKSPADCVQFYYIWKKARSDEQRRLNAVRQRRREQIDEPSLLVRSSATAALGAAQRLDELHHSPLSD
jgi:hypothetical protein